jgi:hypothetical protein
MFLPFESSNLSEPREYTGTEDNLILSNCSLTLDNYGVKSGTGLTSRTFLYSLAVVHSRDKSLNEMPIL